MVQQAIVVKRAIDKNLKLEVIKGAAKEGKLTRGWKQVQPSQRKRSVMDDTYMRKKHAKWIGRACQLQRLIKNKGMDDTRKDPQGHDLLCKLFTTAEIRDGKVEELLQRRLKGKNELNTKYENSLKQIRMASWKDRMQSSVAEVSKWIERKSQPAMCLPAECSGRSGVTTEITQFWEKEWDKPQEDPQSRQDRWNRFMLHPVGKLAARNNTIGERWQRPRDAAWHNARRKASGSGGPDGTTGVEFHNLPSPVINLFRTLTATWERTKLAPTSMSRIRQAALQKPGKPNTIRNLLPIAVMSAWWRLYESAWVQSDSLVAWRHKIGRGHNVAYIESSEQVAATVNKAWRAQNGGYVAAMDFSKAFDHMALELSKQAMIAAGWPENIATLMGDVWKAQERTVCFGGHQDPVSLKTTCAHPRGGQSAWLTGAWSVGMLAHWWQVSWNGRHGRKESRCRKTGASYR